MWMTDRWSPSSEPIAVQEIERQEGRRDGALAEQKNPPKFLTTGELFVSF